jgi:flagellin
MTVINTNVASLNAQAAIASNQRGLNKAMEQLSTGKRINSASDDAAGLAISSKLTAQIRGLNQAVRNANDAISMIKTAEGATNEITNMLQRMRELAIQAANDTNDTDTDREALDVEFSALLDEIDRVAATTQWNGMNVIDGTFGTTGANYHIGAQSAATVTENAMEVVFADFTSTELGAAGATITWSGIDVEADINGEITKIDTAINYVNSERAKYGAYVNRLQYTVDNLTNISTNSAASRSRIEDTDYSQATTELAKRQIIQQAATAMLAQANQQPQAVLSLLK